MGPKMGPFWDPFLGLYIKVLQLNPPFWGVPGGVPGDPPWGPPWGGPPGGPPGGGKKCTFFWVFNNSPSRDSLGPPEAPPGTPPGPPWDGGNPPMHGVGRVFIGSME